MKFLYLLIFLLHTVDIYCKEYIRVEKGNSVIIECTKNKTERCMLLKNTHFEADRTGGNKFTVVNSSTCMFQATNLDFKDNGHYVCHSDTEKEFILLVTVTPHEPEFWHLGMKLRNNTKSITVTRPDGTAEFECRSNQGYPKTNFLWFVDDVQRLDAHERVLVQDSLLNTRSILTVNFDDSLTYSFDGLRHPKEKVIKCKVVHDAYGFNETRILQGTFGREYPTEKVEIIVENPLESIINPGDNVTIDCVADGLPEADDFQIMRETADGEWELISSFPNTIITEPGTYVCEARNSLNARLLGNYTRSNTVTFEGPIAENISKIVNFGLIIGLVFAIITFIAVIIVIAFYFMCPDKLLCYLKEKKEKRSHSDAKNEKEKEKMFKNEQKATEEILQSEI